MTHDIGSTTIRVTDQAADQRAGMLQLAGELQDRLTEVDRQIHELEQMLPPFGPAAAGGADASTAEESLMGAGAAPVAGVADQAAAPFESIITEGETLVCKACGATSPTAEVLEGERHFGFAGNVPLAGLLDATNQPPARMDAGDEVATSPVLESKKYEISPVNQERIIKAACALAANGGQAAQIKSTYAALVEVVTALTSPADRS